MSIHRVRTRFSAAAMEEADADAAAEDARRREVESSSVAGSQPSVDQPTSSVGAEGGSSAPKQKKYRGVYTGTTLNKHTENGQKKLEIAFSSDGLPGIVRPDKELANTAQLVRWITNVTKDVFRTPKRKIHTMTEVERQQIQAKIMLNFYFTGTTEEKGRIWDFCFDKVTRSLRDWRTHAKAHWKEHWAGKAENQRQAMEGISPEDWADLDLHFQSESHQVNSY